MFSVLWRKRTSSEAGVFCRGSHTAGHHPPLQDHEEGHARSQLLPGLPRQSKRLSGWRCLFQWEWSCAAYFASFHFLPREVQRTVFILSALGGLQHVNVTQQTFSVSWVRDLFFKSLKRSIYLRDIPDFSTVFFMFLYASCFYLFSSNHNDILLFHFAACFCLS